MDPWERARHWARQADRGGAEISSDQRQGYALASLAFTALATTARAEYVVVLSSCTVCLRDPGENTIRREPAVRFEQQGFAWMCICGTELGWTDRSTPVRS